MRPDEMTLDEQLIASTAVANYRREQMTPTNGKATVSVTAPTAALVPNGSYTQQHLEQHTAFSFRTAVKRDTKLRLALSGPGGSGKTYTLLKLASELAGRIAVVDTEHGSASKYADEFEFDVLELASYDPGLVPRLIEAVAAQGYSTLVIDSLSHFWSGTDGALDQVDKITMRTKGNGSWTAWHEVSPKYNRMLDAILSAPLHVLVSMRVKTDWIVEKDGNGKLVPRKVGLQPVMRDGIEYEFDVCAEMDQENTMLITKSRCPQLTGAGFHKPGPEVAAVLKTWLGGHAERSESAANAAVPAAEETKTLEKARQSRRQRAGEEPVPAPLQAIWRRMATPQGMMREFEQLYQALEGAIGPEAGAEFSRILSEHGVEEPMAFRDRQAARMCAKRLFFRITNAGTAPGEESGSAATPKPNTSAQEVPNAG